MTVSKLRLQFGLFNTLSITNRIKNWTNNLENGSIRSCIPISIILTPNEVWKVIAQFFAFVNGLVDI